MLFRISAIAPFRAIYPYYKRTELFKGKYINIREIEEEIQCIKWLIKTSHRDILQVQLTDLNSIIKPIGHGQKTSGG